MKLPLLALNTAHLIPENEETQPLRFNEDWIAENNNHEEIFSSFRDEFLRNVFLPPLECYSRRAYVSNFLTDSETYNMVDWELETRSSRGNIDDFVYEYKYKVQPSLNNNLTSPFVNLTGLEDGNQVLDAYIFISHEQFQIKYLRSILSQHILDNDGNTQPEISSDVIGSENTSVGTESSYRVRDILIMFFQRDSRELGNYSSIDSFKKLATEKMFTARYGDEYVNNEALANALLTDNTQQSLLDALDFFAITTITTVLVLYRLLVLCDSALVNLYERPDTGPGFLRTAKHFSKLKRARTEG